MDRLWPAQEILIDMIKYLLSFFMVIICAPAFSQWAVYDDEVYKQLVLVNKIKNFDGLGAGKTYDGYESERSSDAGDSKVGSGDGLAIIKVSKPNLKGCL